MEYTCDFCGSKRKRLTIFQHPTGARLHLCFHVCQHFPEPFKKTGLSDEWERVDPWQGVIRRQPGLQKRKENQWRISAPSVAEVKGRIDSPVLEVLELCPNCRMAGAIEAATPVKAGYVSPPPPLTEDHLLRGLAPEPSVNHHNSRVFIPLAGLLVVGTIAAFYLGSQPATEYPAWVASLMHVLPFAFLGLDSITFAIFVTSRHGGRNATHK
jgi:hypothetical protein